MPGTACCTSGKTIEGWLTLPSAGHTRKVTLCVNVHSRKGPRHRWTTFDRPSKKNHSSQSNMEIEDHGKERRNALLIACAIFAAGFLNLKVPSFVSEFIKMDVPPETIGRSWLLAIVVLVYVTMRYHFSDGKKKSRDAERAEFADWYVHEGPVKIFQTATKFDAITLLKKEVQDRFGTTAGFSPNLGDVTPTLAVPIFRRKGRSTMALEWTLSPQAIDRFEKTLESFRPTVVTENATSFLDHLWIRMRQVMHRLCWSKGAWEVNVVYLAAAFALVMCLIRAEQAPIATPKPQTQTVNLLPETCK